MKAVFNDEIVGLAGNSITDKTMKDFQRKREKGSTFENPMFVEWEYGQPGEDNGMGYWTIENMNELVGEFIKMFEFLYPGHVPLLNIDRSSNHSTMAPDARTLANMQVRASGKQTVNNTLEPMPVFKNWILKEGDIEPNVPEEWRNQVQVGKPFYFCFKGCEVPFYPLQQGQTRDDIRGKALGKRELAYRLG